MDDACAIKMVSLIRTGSATHTLAQDQLYVRIPFKVINDKDNKGKGKGHAYGNNMIEVTAPTKPVQAKPGDYMLFIVNQKGVPSMPSMCESKPAATDKDYVHLFTKQFPGEGGDGEG